MVLAKPENEVKAEPEDLAAVRERLQGLPSLAAHATGTPINQAEIFFPWTHVEALDPEVPLVVGNRGMGKSFWASALLHPDTRNETAEAYAGSNAVRLRDLEVEFGFADAEGGHGAISRAQIQILGDIPPESIWRAVIIRKLANIAGLPVPQRFGELVKWLQENVDDQLSVIRAADKKLNDEGRRVLFLFDQLDQLAESWPHIQTLSQGLLKVALAMKSYRSILLKIFMRPDQAESKTLFQFPDASKIYGSRARLSWRSIDLYGLLYFELQRSDGSKNAFWNICRACGIDPDRPHNRLRIPEGVAEDQAAQHRVFDIIAGMYMGKGKKRGFPYTWVPAHLADAHSEVSPRTFLKVLKTAAQHPPLLERTAIDYAGIQEGVRDASEDRLRELEEDYPWVSHALEPLRGLLVPCEENDIRSRWHDSGTIGKIATKFAGAISPLTKSAGSDSMRRG